MKAPRTLLFVPSWEPRCLLGFERLVSQQRVDRVIGCFSSEYAKQTLSTRDAIAKLCKRLSINIELVPLDFQSSSSTWRRLQELIVISLPKSTKVLLDITTMPRDMLWSALYILREKRISCEYCYHTPKEYHSTWLSRDPGQPRLLYKMSGRQKLGAATALLIITGFDVERTQQLIEFFEPKEAFLGIQTGPQYENIRLNTEKHMEYFGNRPDVKFFELDAYDPSHGFEKLMAQLRRIRGPRNIIGSSLGPKISAIALFRAKWQAPDLGLAYVAAREYNSHYSKGIGETLSGRLVW